MKQSEHNSKLYDKVINNGYHVAHQEKNNKIINLINNNPKKILDVGCGDGWFASKLKKKFKAEVHGIDIAKKALEKAQGRGIKTKKFDLEKEKWPYKDNSFDLIIAGDIIEHVYDTENFIKECKRILKEKGELIISTPNINSYQNRLLVPMGLTPFWIDFAPNISTYPPLPTSGHVRVFNKKTIKQLINHFDLKIDCLIGAGFLMNKKIMPSRLKKFAGIINKIEGFFGKFPSMASLIIIKVIKE